MCVRASVHFPQKLSFSYLWKMENCRHKASNCVRFMFEDSKMIKRCPFINVQQIFGSTRNFIDRFPDRKKRKRDEQNDVEVILMTGVLVNDKTDFRWLRISTGKINEKPEQTVNIVNWEILWTEIFSCVFRFSICNKWKRTPKRNAMRHKMLVTIDRMAERERLRRVKEKAMQKTISY